MRRLVLLAVVVAVGVCAPVALGATRVSLHAPRHVGAGGLVSFAGQAGTRAGSDIVVERRLGQRWAVLVAGRTGFRGRFVLSWIAPARAERLVVRAAEPQGGRASARRSLVIGRRASGAVVVSPSTRVLAGSVISSAPAPGHAGALVYSGGEDVGVGQILVAGASAATPDGFLGRVVGVQLDAGRTVVSTVPATLEQAVPYGSLDLSASSTSASAARVSRVAHAAATVTCQGSGGVTITRSVSFSTGLELKGAWSLLHGLQSASLTASASASASIKAVEQAAGSCALGSTAILSFPGPSVDGFVGPVPIVMTSRVTVYLDASISAKASMTESADAGFSASAGIGWTKQNGFYPIDRIDAHFDYQPPTLAASANAAVNVTPTLDVLLYGVVGPQIALKTGLAFNADIHKNPWWTLTAPLDLTASIAIPALHLTSPTLHVYQHTFPIANAGGPFGAGTGTGTGTGTTPTITSPGDQTTAEGTAVDLDIQAADADGAALSYSAVGLPAGLAIDPNRGEITGTPTTQGTSSVTITVADATGSTATDSFNWTVVAATDPSVVSVDYRGLPGNGTSNEARISRDGRYVWFQSSAQLLDKPMAYPAGEVYVRDLTRETTTAVEIPAESGWTSEELLATSPNGQFALINHGGDDSTESPYRYDVATGTLTQMPVNAFAYGIDDAGDVLSGGYGPDVAEYYDAATGVTTNIPCPGSVDGQGDYAAAVYLDSDTDAAVSTDACSGQIFGYLVNLRSLTATKLLTSYCNNLGNACYDGIGIDDAGTNSFSFDCCNYNSSTNSFYTLGLYDNSPIPFQELDAPYVSTCGLSPDGSDAVFWVSGLGIYDYNREADTTTLIEQATPANPYEECAPGSLTSSGTVAYERSDGQIVLAGT